MTHTTILGVDSGTKKMGWGVVRQDDSQLRYVQHGAVPTPPDWPMPRRLSRLYDGLSRLLEGYKPDALAVQGLSFDATATTTITAGQAQARLCLGVALLAADHAGVTVTGYTPPQVMRALPSSGRTDERRVQEMVKVSLGLPAIPRPEEAAGGLAVAMTHAFSSRPRQPLLRRVK